MPDFIDGSAYRTTDHPIEPIFTKRWSPRAMSGEPLEEAKLMSLFEAARWAPSTYNEQEWRFCYARRDTPHWEPFFNLLAEPNKVWCGNAAVLGVVLSRTTLSFNGKNNHVHTFDAGLAYMSLALQGAAMGLVVHGMAGFDVAAAFKLLEAPENYAVNTMFAVGHPGDPAVLPGELRSKEQPSNRRSVGEIACEGQFAFEPVKSE